MSQESDNLHTALPTCWYCPDCRGVWRYEPDYTEHDDCDDEGTPIVVSLIPPSVASDPVRRLAILNLIGDVREGWLCPHCDFTWPTEPIRSHSDRKHVGGVTCPGVPERVLVVRPKEAPDV